MVNEQIFEISHDSLRKMVILDGSMEKLAEVFWYLGRNSMRCVSRYRSGIRIGLNDCIGYLLANLWVLWSTLSGGCVDWKKTGLRKWSIVCGAYTLSKRYESVVDNGALGLEHSTWALGPR